jgi:hypothetical protein
MGPPLPRLQGAGTPRRVNPRQLAVGGIGASISLLTGAPVNQRMGNKICWRQDSDLRVDLVDVDSALKCRREYLVGNRWP